MQRNIEESFIVENPNLSPEICAELKTLDYFHDLPKWAVLKDQRTEKGDRIDRDNFIVNKVDSLCDEIKNGDSAYAERIDDELTKWMYRILLMADRQRDRFGATRYSNDSIITLIYEIWYSDYLHRNHSRQSGENYARTHLFESVINAIRDEGVSDLYTIVSILKHDDLEDYADLGFDKEEPEKLLCIELYEDKLSGEGKYSSVEIQMDTFRTEVLKAVKAVTLYNKGRSLDEKHGSNFRRSLDSLRQHGFRPTKVRLGEREHNIKTLSGKPKAKGDEYALKTLQVYPRFAAFNGLRRVEENIMRGCYKQIDPDVLTYFDLESLRRLNSRFGYDKSQSKLLSTLKNLGRVGFIKFLAVKPYPLSHYLDSTEGMEGLDKIAEQDPMFEVVILVNESSHIALAKDRVVQAMRTSDNFLNVKLRYDKDIQPQTGLSLRIDNPDPDQELGGYLNVRINTIDDEVRCDQGRDQSKSEAVKEILNRTRKGVRGIFEMAEEIGGGEISIYTPKRERIRLPVGATGLDFTAQIHGKLLWDLRGMRVEDPDTLHYVPANPLDERSDGEKVRIIKEGDPYFDPKIDIYKADYGCFPFANSNTKKWLRAYLKGIDEEERVKLFAEYLGIVCSILGLSRKTLRTGQFFHVLLLAVEDEGERKGNQSLISRLNYLRHMLKENKNDSPQTQALNERFHSTNKSYGAKCKIIVDGLMNGSIDVLKVFADMAEEDNYLTVKKGKKEMTTKIDKREPMLVSFDLPDLPGIGSELLNEFGKIGVNVKILYQLKNPNASNRDFLHVSLEIVDEKKTSLHDLLLTLLKINYKYPVRTSTSPFQDIFESRIASTTYKPNKKKPKRLAPRQS